MRVEQDKALEMRIISELTNETETELHQDRSTNALIRRYHAMR